MSKSWDSGILKKLKALVGKGLSTAEIGKRLGMSKNAIVGKLHRLGWNAKNEVAPAKKSAAAPVKKTTTKKAPATPVKKSTATKKVATKIAPVKAKPVKETKAKAKPKVEPKKTVVKKESVPVAPKVTKKISEGKNLAVHQRIVQHSLEMAALKPGQCRWPIGDPDSENFHFCGQPVFVGKPYCYEHCRQAYQFAAPKRK